jgi:hypothetical protein
MQAIVAAYEAEDRRKEAEEVALGVGGGCVFGPEDVKE